MLGRLLNSLAIEKQKNAMLRVIAFMSLFFASLYLVMFILSSIPVTWTWILQTSPSIQVYHFALIGWRIDRIILIIFCGSIAMLLVQGIKIEQEKEIPSSLTTTQDILKIIGVVVMVCSIVIVALEVISTSVFLRTDIPDPYSEGMFIAGKARIGQNDILWILISVFCLLLIIHSILNLVEKKYSKKLNGFAIILLTSITLILIANVLENFWVVDQDVLYIVDYVLKFISYAWFGFASLIMIELF